MMGTFCAANTRIVTERLILRKINTYDIDDFYSYAKVDGVGEAAGWHHHTDIEKSHKLLTSFIDDDNVIALEIPFENKSIMIGTIGLHGSWANKDVRYSHLPLREIGYVLSKDYWGRGLMSEAVNAVIAHCFENLNYACMTVCHFLSNDKSRRVIEKCKYGENRFDFSQEDNYKTSMGTMEREAQYIMMNPIYKI